MTDDDRTVMAPTAEEVFRNQWQGEFDPLQPPYPDPRRSVSGGGERADVHPWERHDFSCHCHIGICPDCGCTNEYQGEQEAAAARPTAPWDRVQTGTVIPGLDDEEAARPTPEPAPAHVKPSPKRPRTIAEAFKADPDFLYRRPAPPVRWPEYGSCRHDLVSREDDTGLWTCDDCRQPFAVAPADEAIDLAEWNRAFSEADERLLETFDGIEQEAAASQPAPPIKGYWSMESKTNLDRETLEAVKDQLARAADEGAEAVVAAGLTFIWTPVEIRPSPSLDVRALSETLRYLHHADQPCDRADEHKHDDVARGIVGQYPRFARLAQEPEGT